MDVFDDTSAGGVHRQTRECGQPFCKGSILDIRGWPRIVL